MNFNLPGMCAANEKLILNAIKWWSETAAEHNINLAGFDSNACLEERLAWANKLGFAIGTIYSRCYLKVQQSKEDQVREVIQWAAKDRIYIPPEFICVDESAEGKRTKRDGLVRANAILREGLATVLLAYEASRLFRQAGKTLNFIEEEVVEKGLRAVIVSQRIDTDDRKAWKMQLQIHSVMADTFLNAIADHGGGDIRHSIY